MKARIIAAVAIVLGALAGAFWSRAQSAFPIRLDHESTAGAVQNPQMIDDYLVLVTSPVQGSAEVEVSRSELIERCSDNDGCTLRLVQIISESSAGADSMKARLFSVNEPGESWDVFSFLGMSEGSGTTLDSVEEVITGQAAGQNTCQFIDSGTNNDFRVRSTNDLPTSFWDCVLRVED